MKIPQSKSPSKCSSKSLLELFTSVWNTLNETRINCLPQYERATVNEIGLMKCHFIGVFAILNISFIFYSAYWASSVLSAFRCSINILQISTWISPRSLRKRIIRVHRLLYSSPLRSKRWTYGEKFVSKYCAGRVAPVRRGDRVGCQALPQSRYFWWKFGINFW